MAKILVIEDYNDTAELVTGKNKVADKAVAGFEGAIQRLKAR
jgi:hypothetical protein